MGLNKDLPQAGKQFKFECTVSAFDTIFTQLINVNLYLLIIVTFKGTCTHNPCWQQEQNSLLLYMNSITLSYNGDHLECRIK